MSITANITKRIEVTASGNVFVIPNSAAKVSELLLDSDKLAYQRIAVMNDTFLTDDDLLVQVWISSDDLETENLNDHGGQFLMPVDGEDEPVDVAVYVRCTYVPAKLLAKVREGSTFSLAIPAHHGLRMDKSGEKLDDVILHLNLTANQQEFRYRRFGKFEDVMRYVGAGSYIEEEPEEKADTEEAKEIDPTAGFNPYYR